VVFERGDRSLLVTAATNQARAYDPETGKELWRLAGHSEIAVPTPIASKNLIFISSGYRPIRPVYAVRFDARGTLDLPAGKSSSEQIAWSVSQGGPYVPTPIVYGGLLYVCTDEGILTCYQAATGKRIYRHRLRSGEARSFSASPVAADGKLYFTAEEGATLVVKAGPKCEILSTNPLGELCLATPAIADGLFIVRTQGHVIALGK
jgi:outer membrane protein assembly factor BamB